MFRKRGSTGRAQVNAGLMLTFVVLLTSARSSMSALTVSKSPLHAMESGVCPF